MSPSAEVNIGNQRSARDDLSVSSLTIKKSILDEKLQKWISSEAPELRHLPLNPSPSLCPSQNQ